ncbi:MAG: zinc-dependent metalloprotease [Acidimicrobiia bacterium]|nr:zinc-dependent metalloprotease [Acidimicrobiia bacterium]
MALPARDFRGPEPIDWRLAQRIARSVAGRDAFATSYLASSLTPDFSAATADAEAAVAEYTGLRSPDLATAEVVDRAGWVNANVRSMQRMLAPLTDRVSERMAKSPFAPVGRRVAGTELGVLLGYVSQRVLGQYDLLVPDEEGAPTDDRVYYVGANILGLEKRFAFRPGDFRLWIALHEVTHRAQFTGVPWLREYFVAQVHELMVGIEPDPGIVFAAIGRAADAIRVGKNPVDERGLMGLFANEEQRAAMDRMQALMSLLEGHGNAVMNHLGAQMLHGQERMAAVLSARRATRGPTALFHKLIGLDMKMRQYEVGEAFVEGVTRAAGFRALDAAWASPASLPTLAELVDPTAWLDRVRTVAAR